MFVIDEVVVAGIGPCCQGLDLCALVVDWARLYKMNQAKRASRIPLLRERTSRLDGWTARDKYQLTE